MGTAIMFTAGLLTALGVVIIAIKLSKDTLKKLLGYDVIVDMLVTAGLAWLLAGSYAGIMAAIVGGITVSVMLHFAKKRVGYQRWSKVTCTRCGHSKREWTESLPG